MAQPISRVPRQVSRRRFLTLSVALGASSALLAACAPAAPAAKPTEAPKPAAPTTAPAAPAAAAKPTEAPKPAEKPAEAKPAAPAPTTAPAAAAKPAAGEPRRGGTIRISMDGDWKTLDAALYQNITDRQLLYSLYNSLVQLDDKLNVIPSLAESWEVAPDALSWTFKLRSGVKFHDGTPFNAAAVKFNIERIMNPDTASRLRAELLDLQEVQAPDDNTVKFILKQPFTPLLGWMAEVPGFMSSPTAIQKWGKEYGDHPVATGPFEFVEQVKGDHLTLKRFEGYWEQGVPYVDGVVFRPIPDPSTKLAGLRAGSLDLVDDVPPREQAGLANNPEIQLAPNQSTRWPMIRLNLGAAPMDNKAFRQALSMAVDRDGIIKAIYFGNATPAYGPIAPIYSAYYDPGISEYGLKFDLAKAKAKMAESGVSTPVTVRLDMQGTPEYTRMAEIIKATWAEIGVNAEISAFDSNTLTDRMRNASFQASIGSWTPRPDVDGVVYRHYRTGSAFNYLKYSEPAVDQMLDQSRRLPPGPERVKVFQDIQKRIVDDAPWIFLVFENQAYAMSKSVQGLPIIPDTMIRPKTVWLRQ